MLLLQVNHTGRYRKGQELSGQGSSDCEGPRVGRCHFTGGWREMRCNKPAGTNREGIQFAAKIDWAYDGNRLEGMEKQAF